MTNNAAFSNALEFFANRLIFNSTFACIKS